MFDFSKAQKYQSLYDENLHYNETFLMSTTHTMRTVLDLLVDKTPIKEFFVARIQDNQILIACTDVKLAKLILENDENDWKANKLAPGINFSFLNKSTEQKHLQSTFGIDSMMRHIYNHGNDKEIFCFFSSGCEEDSYKWHYANLGILAQIEIMISLEMKQKHLVFVPQPEPMRSSNATDHDLARFILQTSMKKYFSLSNVQVRILRRFRRNMTIPDISSVTDYPPKMVARIIEHTTQQLGLSSHEELREFSRQYIAF